MLVFSRSSWYEMHAPVAGRTMPRIQTRKLLPEIDCQGSVVLHAMPLAILIYREKKVSKATPRPALVLHTPSHPVKKKKKKREQPRASLTVRFIRLNEEWGVNKLEYMQLLRLWRSSREFDRRGVSYALDTGHGFFF